MNPDGKKSVVITLLTTMLTLVFFAASIENRSTAQDSTHSPPASVSLGLWGGPDLEMQVTPHGATLEFDCAQGTISEPLALDQSGTFHARGSFQTQGGAARKVQPSGGINVIYSGNLRGETLQIEFTVGENAGENKQPPQKFTLIRGQAGNLKKCH
ncbi:MAG: hypothetical protein WCA97_04680 [Terriglobales bacterium]